MTPINQRLSILGWSGLFHIGPTADVGIDGYDNRLQLLGHVSMTVENNITQRIKSFPNIFFKGKY